MSMFYGLFNLPWWGCVIVTLILTHITIVSVTVYLHRTQAHRGMDVHPIVSHFFRFWLWLTTGMITREWVAIHRKHHVECETENDPHSPQIYGIKKLLLEGTELYRAEAKNTETLERYGRGTPNDWMERTIYTGGSRYGIIIMLLINLLCFGVYGITMWAVQMLWIPVFAAGVVNGIGHYWGYRNFECADQSRNILPFGFLIGGEELHNNHHTFPTSAKLSVKWWEFDIGWFYISILKFLRLAKVYKVPPKLAKVPGKAQVDLDTLRAIFSARFQIMERYSKRVVIPILLEEKRRAGDAGKQLYRKAKRLFIKNDALVDADSKQRLAMLLKQSERLQLVYQYRTKLQEIWTRTQSSQKELLDALQEWCKQAEATGIEALRDFVNTLKTYVPRPAAS